MTILKSSVLRLSVAPFFWLADATDKILHPIIMSIIYSMVVVVLDIVLMIVHPSLHAWALTRPDKI